jgi:methylated-DNA-[protein]-cysteine S-methyltransferase
MTGASFCTMESPVGLLAIHMTGDAITALDWVDSENSPPDTPNQIEATRQLAAYFAGDLQNFTLPLTPEGTVHQKKVWAEMSKVPFGDLRTYGDLAQTISSGAQAVGNACSKNPIPIIVPCHRIIAAGGGIGGYSGRGGIVTKQILLTLEGAEPGP